MKSILDIECSMFDSAYWKAEANRWVYPFLPLQRISLLEFLQMDVYQNKKGEKVSAASVLKKLRVAKDDDQRGQLKPLLPTITPSAVFEGRRKKGSPFSHTGVICIDIDLKQNTHISNFKALKVELAKIEQVAFAGHSASGKGYMVLIPISEPARHKDHFRYIQTYFRSKSLIIDESCSDVTRLRYYSNDPEAYLNHNAKSLCSFQEMIIPETEKKVYISGNSVFARYNQKLDFINVLINHGWKIESQNSKKIMFTRPGKDSGVSADFTFDKNVLKVFSSNADPFSAEEGKAYNPFQIFCELEHGGDTAKAAKELELQEDFEEEVTE